MEYIGVDLHKQTLVAAVECDEGPVGRPVTLRCEQPEKIRSFFEAHRPFGAVIEASSSYRWLYDMVAPLGDVCVAHPGRLRAIVAGRAKTDKLDAKLLATLLRANLIPRAYVPPAPYAALRTVTRARSRLARHGVHAKNELHALLIRANLHAPCRDVFSKIGRRWLAAVALDDASGLIRDELLRRIAYYDQELAALDSQLHGLTNQFPETAAVRELHGIGPYSALLIVAEIGEPWRFRTGRQVGAYAGLTARVHQSGMRTYHGHITRQGSPWLRWVLVQAAMHIVRKDRDLKNLYTRIRKRSSAHIARVAVARKLATICWVRLMRWHAAHPA